MKWRDLDTSKPKDGERVLFYHPQMNYPGPWVGIGEYLKSQDIIRPNQSHGYDDIRWWAPLPTPPKDGDELRPKKGKVSACKAPSA
jgi:hypothetical protein